MPGMTLNSVCLDNHSPSSSSFSASTRSPPTEVCATTSSQTSSRSEAVGKKRSGSVRHLELRRDLLNTFDMSAFSTTEMFGQMTPAHEEEMQLGGNTTEVGQSQQPPIQPNDPATATPEDSDDEFELSWEQFEKHYVPLSHLPTPPWSDSSSVEMKESGSDDDEILDPEFYAPARYLATMTPRNASRESPSVKRLQNYLQRANLKIEVMALAGCILDCLSGRFVRQWRTECSSALEEETDSPEAGSTLVAIAALCVAMKFMEDSSYTTRFWSLVICESFFSPTVLAVTERLVLADLGYCLHGISAPDMLQYIIEEIQRYAEPTDAVASSSLYSSDSKLVPSPSTKVERAPSPFPMLS